MPWPKDHKARTRARIVSTAAAAVRARGVSGVGVADLMAEAGLTHGGFYAHFASKEDLLAEALEHAGRESFTRLLDAIDSAPEEARLHAVVDAYLSPWHLAHVDVGCPVAALGPEVARAGGPMRAHLGRTIRQRLEWLRGLLPEGPRGREREEQVVGVLAGMLGGLILARALGEGESKALLDACRGFLHRALAAAPAPAGRTKAGARRIRKAVAPRRKPPARRRRTT